MGKVGHPIHFPVLSVALSPIFLALYSGGLQLWMVQCSEMLAYFSGLCSSIDAPKPCYIKPGCQRYGGAYFPLMLACRSWLSIEKRANNTSLHPWSVCK